MEIISPQTSRGLVMHPRGDWRRRLLGQNCIDKCIDKCPMNTEYVCHARQEKNRPALDPSASSVGQVNCSGGASLFGVGVDRN